MLAGSSISSRIMEPHEKKSHCQEGFARSPSATRQEKLSSVQRQTIHPHGRGEDIGPCMDAPPDPKHPHRRGEDASWFTSGPDVKETPPRAWGRQSLFARSANEFRNTPTGVGKTSWTLWMTD